MLHRQRPPDTRHVGRRTHPKELTNDHEDQAEQSSVHRRGRRTLGAVPRTGDARLRDRLVLSYSPLVKYIVFKKVRDLPRSLRGRRLHLLWPGGADPGARPLGAEQGRHPRAVRVDPHPRRRHRRAAPAGLGPALAAPLGARHRHRRPRPSRGLHGRPPTRGELADSLGVSSEELRRREHDIATSNLTSINSLVNGEGQVDRAHRHRRRATTSPPTPSTRRRAARPGRSSTPRSRSCPSASAPSRSSCTSST